MTYHRNVTYSIPLEANSNFTLAPKAREEFPFEYTPYSPSILLISDNSSRLRQLNEWLQPKYYQVETININHNKLAPISKNYFDLIIIDLEAFEKAGPDRPESLINLLQRLKNYPGLSSLPMIVLASCQESRPQIRRFAPGPVYCLARDASTKASLLQIVAQIHYLTYRYV